MITTSGYRRRWRDERRRDLAVALSVDSSPNTGGKMRITTNIRSGPIEEGDTVLLKAPPLPALGGSQIYRPDSRLPLDDAKLLWRFTGSASLGSRCCEVDKAVTSISPWCAVYRRGRLCIRLRCSVALEVIGVLYQDGVWDSSVEDTGHSRAFGRADRGGTDLYR
jgi:hypothetical protein